MKPILDAHKLISFLVARSIRTASFRQPKSASLKLGMPEKEEYYKKISDSATTKRHLRRTPQPLNNLPLHHLHLTPPMALEMKPFALRFLFLR